MQAVTRKHDGRKDKNLGRRIQWPSSVGSDVSLPQLQSCAMPPPAPHVNHLGTWNNGHASWLSVNSVTPTAKVECQAQFEFTNWNIQKIWINFSVCICVYACYAHPCLHKCTCMCRCMGKPENNLCYHASRTMHLLFWRRVLPLAWSSLTRLHWLVMAPGTCLLPFPRSQIASMHRHAWICMCVLRITFRSQGSIASMLPAELSLQTRSQKKVFYTYFKIKKQWLVFSHLLPFAYFWNFLFFLYSWVFSSCYNFFIISFAVNVNKCLSLQGSLWGRVSLLVKPCSSSGSE